MFAENATPQENWVAIEILRDEIKALGNGELIYRLENLAAGRNGNSELSAFVEQSLCRLEIRRRMNRGTD